jgi:hypothetical protein
VRRQREQETETEPEGADSRRSPAGNPEGNGRGGRRSNRRNTRTPEQKCAPILAARNVQRLAGACASMSQKDHSGHDRGPADPLASYLSAIDTGMTRLGSFAPGQLAR